jgi:uncharacterized protein with FMN-binding domain
MRRVIPTLLVTVVGLVLIASFHTSSAATRLTSPSSGAALSPSTSSPPAGASPPPSSAGSSNQSQSSGSSSQTRQYVGSTIENRYGPVQVRITVRGSTVSDIEALQMPGDREHSARLSTEAGPVLRSEALQAQSARIDVVSGATFTSESYAQSLQSALDQAHLGR